MDPRYRGLVPYRPGDEWTGNAKGRPKGSVNLTTLIQRALAGTSLGGAETPDGRTVGEWLIDHLVKQAMGGNAAIARMLIDRNDGRQPTPQPETREAESFADAVAEAERLATEHELEREREGGDVAADHGPAGA